MKRIEAGETQSGRRAMEEMADSLAKHGVPADRAREIARTAARRKASGVIGTPEDGRRKQREIYERSKR